ncbi:MAG TPA: VOC family protein [Nonomuraea sp.]|nr:VOC family protein [Nonomuraea sp.]
MFDTLRLLPMLPAHDPDRARDWYRDHLGLTPTRELPELEMNVFPGFISYRSPNAGTARSTAAVWLAPDFDAAVAELRRRAVPLETYDMPELSWEDGVATDPLGGHACWFVDSEGNTFMVSDLGVS